MSIERYFLEGNPEELRAAWDDWVAEKPHLQKLYVKFQTADHGCSEGLVEEAAEEEFAAMRAHNHINQDALATDFTPFDRTPNEEPWLGRFVRKLLGR